MTSDPTPWFAGAFFTLWLGAIFLALVGTVFWIIELVDVARREFPDPNTKIIWILVVVLSHGIGALIYFFVGRSQGWLPGQGPRITSGRPSQGDWPPPPAL